MTTKEQLNDAREKYYEAYGNYIKTAEEVVKKEGGLYLEDEDGQPIHIHVSNLDHNHEYFPSFDQVNVQVKNLFGEERIVFLFHVVEGDDLFPDNTWVSEDDFADERWEELLNYIVWDD